MTDTFFVDNQTVINAAWANDVNDATYKGKIRPQLSRQVPIIWDDFDDVDQVLNGRVCPSGQRWSVLGLGATVAGIKDGVLVGNGLNHNFYASLPSPTRISFLGGVFSYIKGSGSDVNATAGCVLIAQSAAADLGNMLHCIFGPSGWSLTKRQAGGAFVGIGSGEYDLAFNGTRYFCGMEIIGNTVTIYSPDGTVTTITDTSIPSIELLTGTIQIGTEGATSACVGRWHSFAIGKDKYSAISLFDGGVSSGEVTRIAGYGLGKRDSGTFSITSDGWYRLAYNTTTSGYYLNGRVKLSTTSTSGVSTDTFDGYVKGQGGVSALVTPQQMSGGYNLQQIRAGADPTGVFVDVYIGNTITGVVTLIADVEGYMHLYPKLISSPTTPAITSTTTVSTLVPNTLAGIATTTDWYRLATQTSGPGGYLASGIIRIKASDAGRSQVFDLSISAYPSAIYTIQVDGHVGISEPITQIRVSRETNKVAVDVYCAYAGTNNLTIEAQYFGWFGVPSSLAVGAALATETQTKGIIANYQNIKLYKTDPIYDSTVTYISIADGATYTMLASETGVFQVSGALTAMTVTLPPNPVHNHVVSIGSANGVTTLTVNPSVGYTGTFTLTLAAGITAEFRLNGLSATWYRIK